MPALTSKQITELGGRFHAFGKVVGDFRIANADILTADEKKALKGYQKQLLDKADEFYNTSAALVMDEVDDSLKKINDIKMDMDATYTKLKNVQKAIDIAAGCVDLAAAIFTMKPGAIGKSILSLGKLLNIKSPTRSLKITNKKKP